MTVATPTRQLTQAILDSGIQNTNYFNGRILNAGDLQTDQEANRQQHEQLGTAVGAGIVRGLWVELASSGSDGTAPVVAVSQGLAFNSKGEAISLPLNVQVALTRQTTPTAAGAGLFADCGPLSTTAVPVQAGIYILTVSPASGFAGQAPMFSFGDVNAATGCGSRYAVEGVSFRLVQLDVTQLTRLSTATQTAVAQLMTQTDAASLSRLRNWAAHICFGTEELTGFLGNPFARVSSGATTQQSPYVTYGALDALLASGSLTACEVPLALLYWTVQGVQFLDRWSVRRSPVPRLTTTTWPLPLSARRRIEGSAIFLQFQEQAQSLVSSATPATLAAVAASAYFRYLPAGGFLPLASAAFAGFDTTAFFGTKPHRSPEFVDAGLLAGLFDDALLYPPIDLTDAELVWLYQCWQNAKAIADGGSLQPFLVFASGQMRHMALARFDIARWNYANFPE